MIKIASHLLLRDKGKTLITIGGISISIILILFLNGVYEGVRSGVTGYIRHSPADIWMCQKNSTNLLRSSSFISSDFQTELEQVDNLYYAEAVLRTIATCEIKNKTITLFMIGVSGEHNLSAPNIIEGKAMPGRREIILDRSFAQKHGLRISDTLKVQNHSFIIAGLSTETNATVANFCFARSADAAELIGFPGIVSFFLIKSAPGKADSLLHLLKKRFPGFSAFSKSEFIQNHVDEIDNGFLPILWAIAVLGISVGGTLINLMLYSSVLERREDYAILKALGMPLNKMNILVVQQSLFVLLTGYFSGSVLYLALSPALTYFVPEISLMLDLSFLGKVLAISIIVGFIGSFSAVRKVKQIYPAEVFRA